LGAIAYWHWSPFSLNDPFTSRRLLSGAYQSPSFVGLVAVPSRKFVTRRTVSVPRQPSWSEFQLPSQRERTCGPPAGSTQPFSVQAPPAMCARQS
jgi:hypothetical protein